MPQKHPTLWHVREQHGMTRDLLDQFKQKAASDNMSPNAALVRMIRRYLARGLDDGQPTSAPPSDTLERS